MLVNRTVYLYLPLIIIGSLYATIQDDLITTYSHLMSLENKVGKIASIDEKAEAEFSGYLSNALRPLSKDLREIFNQLIGLDDKNQKEKAAREVIIKKILSAIRTFVNTVPLWASASGLKISEGDINPLNQMISMLREIGDVPAETKDELEALSFYLAAIANGDFTHPQYDSLVSDIGQFDKDRDAKTACTAICVRTASKLVECSNPTTLESRCLSDILKEGRTLYEETIISRGSRPGTLLAAGDILKPSNLVQVKEVAGEFNPLLPFKSVFDEMEKQLKASGSAISTVITKGGETFLISVLPDGNWIMYDSHRQNKQNKTGSGFHFFESKRKLMMYLFGYKGLDLSDVKSQIEAGYNYFEATIFKKKG